jgi:hypothetical protein
MMKNEKWNYLGVAPSNFSSKPPISVTLPSKLIAIIVQSSAECYERAAAALHHFCF